MIVDSSALLAVLRNEDDRDALLAAMLGDRAVTMSAGTYLEAAIVADARRNPVLSRRFDELLATIPVEMVAFTAAHARRARAAYRDFGRGSTHPAQLNFGDCFAYALATTTGEALLWKGEDFGHTDARPALP